MNVLSTIGTTGTTGSINLPAGTTTADGVCWGTNCGNWDGFNFHFNGGIISQAAVSGTSFQPYNLSYNYGTFFPGNYTQPVEIIRNIGSGDTYTTLLVETPNTGSLAAQLDLQGPVGDLERFGSKPCETSFGTTTVNTGSATTTTGLTCLPANSVIDGVVYRITTTITTAASFTVGTAGSTSLFCGTQSTLTTGTTGVCMNQTGTTSELQGSAAAVVVTFNATPGAGAIRLVVRYHTLTAPTS